MAVPRLPRSGLPAANATQLAEGNRFAAESGAFGARPRSFRNERILRLREKLAFSD
jgi:hypothetical protein